MSALRFDAWIQAVLTDVLLCVFLRMGFNNRQMRSGCRPLVNRHPWLTSGHPWPAEPAPAGHVREDTVLPSLSSDTSREQGRLVYCRVTGGHSALYWRRLRRQGAAKAQTHPPPALSQGQQSPGGTDPCRLNVSMMKTWFTRVSSGPLKESRCPGFPALLPCSEHIVSLAN